jgi:hypothetical protein
MKKIILLILSMFLFFNGCYSYSNHLYVSSKDIDGSNFINGSNLLDENYYKNTKDLLIDVELRIKPYYFPIFGWIRVGEKGHPYITILFLYSILDTAKENNIEKIIWNSYEIIINGKDRFSEDNIGSEIDFVRLKYTVDGIEKDDIESKSYFFHLDREFDYKFKEGDRIEGTVNITVQKENKTEERKIEFNNVIKRRIEFTWPIME